MSARGKKGGGSNVTPLREFAPPRYDLQRGDGVELARRLLADLRGERPVAVVYDLGAFWRYQEARGVWEKVPDEAATRVLAEYAGLLVPGTGGVPRALKLRASDITGAIAIAQKLAAAPGFFNDAPKGVACANAFVTVASEPDPARGPGAVRGVVRAAPHSPDHRATFALPFDFDPAAAAPRWLRFLHEIWTPPAEGEGAAAADDTGAAPADARAAGAADRDARVRALEEWVGAALLGEIVEHQVCILLVGAEGANGKSVLLRVLRELFPPEAVRSIGPHEWARGFQRAELAGARLNVVNEIPDADVAGGDLFKAIVAGDEVPAERKYTDPFTLKCRAGHIFACNSLPGTRDQSGGFWRRWIVLPFERTFAEGERDLRLAATLRAELPGVAVRMLAAAAALRARGHLEVPASSAEAKARWQFETDSVRQWFAACAVADAEARAKLADLYPSFAQWARANGHVPMASNKFGSALERLKHHRRSKLERWYAVRLRPEAEAKLRARGDGVTAW